VYAGVVATTVPLVIAEVRQARPCRYTTRGFKVSDALASGPYTFRKSHRRAHRRQLREGKMDRAPGKPSLLGIWLEDGYRTKPIEMGSALCKTWTWGNVARFIDGL
jgi:hypothetical protein